MNNPTFNVPGALLGALLVWWALMNGFNSHSLFNVLVLVTGIVWLAAAFGIIGRLKG